MELTQDDIKEINHKCPPDEGIFKEPYGIPVNVKEYVIYRRYETGGVSGGSYHEDSCQRSYTKEVPKDTMMVLDLVIEKIRPKISYLEFKKILRLIHNNSETEYEYYGNSTDWYIEYIKLSDLYDTIAKFDND